MDNTYRKKNIKNLDVVWHFFNFLFRIGCRFLKNSENRGKSRNDFLKIIFLKGSMFRFLENMFNRHTKKCSLSGIFYFLVFAIVRPIRAWKIKDKKLEKYHLENNIFQKFSIHIFFN